MIARGLLGPARKRSRSLGDSPWQETARYRSRFYGSVAVILGLVLWILWLYRHHAC